MRILMINVVCGIRSTGRICTDLAIALEEQGHEVRIAYGREKVPKQFQKYAVRIGNDLDVKIHGLKARLFDGCGFGSKRATKEFVKWVKEYDPDVIHLHNIHGYYINIEVLFEYLRVCGKRIIWTLHDCWAFTGHTPYCDVKECDKWKRGCAHCPGVKEYPRSYSDNSLYNWKRKKELFKGIPNMTIVSPSNWLESLIKQSFLSEYPVRVIYNGIDTTQFYPIENDFKQVYNIEKKYLLLGVATSWDEMKGLSDYFKLADMLGDKYQVVLVGFTKSQIKKLPSNIIGLMRTNNIIELVKIYSASDLYVNLSYSESFGLTNVEAQLCGTPAVGYNSGAMKESINQGGIVVPRGDLQAVVQAIYDIRNGVFIPSLINRDIIDKSVTTTKYLEILKT